MKIIKTAWENFGAGSIRLGRQGENLVRRLKVDISAPLEAHPDADFAIRVESPAGVVYNAAQTVQEDEWLMWDITDADTAVSGEGSVQIVMIGDGEEIAKTAKAKTVVLSSLGSGGEAPDPVKGWLDEAQKLLEDLKDQGSVNEEEVQQIVADWMASHPITETDPTVPEWAKQPQKPTYTAADVGAVSTEELETAKEEIVQDVLDQIPQGGGGAAVQADWSQNDPSQPDYVQNRTHWVEQAYEPIVWDGSTEGREYVDVSALEGAEPGTLLAYKISDTTLSKEQIATSTFEATVGIYDYSDTGFESEDLSSLAPVPAGVARIASFSASRITEDAGEESVCMMIAFFVYDADALNAIGLSVPGNGTYATQSNYVDGTPFLAKISQPSYHKLDKKFLPVIETFKGLFHGDGENSLMLNDEGNTASGHYSLAEGESTTASGYCSHAEGNVTTASGYYSHTEGDRTTASGYRSHAEGDRTTASGDNSHTEGDRTDAIGDNSHAEGRGTLASAKSQHVEGEYNIMDNATPEARGKYLHIAGNGEDDDNRSNAYTLDWLGNGWFAGSVSAKSLKLYSGDTTVELTPGHLGNIGGGLPTGGEPHQQLVTDGEGNAKWEDRLCYEEGIQAVVLPATELANTDGQFIYTGELTNQPIAGANHVVKLTANSHTIVYNCIGIEISEDGMTGVFLGNAAAMGGDDTGELFGALILSPEAAAQAGASAVFMSVGDSLGTDPVTFSVEINSVEVKKKIPSRFFDVTPEIDLISWGFDEFSTDRQTKSFEEIGISFEDEADLKAKLDKLQVIFVHKSEFYPDPIRSFATGMKNLLLGKEQYTFSIMEGDISYRMFTFRTVYISFAERQVMIITNGSPSFS